MHAIRSDSAVSTGIQVDLDYSYPCTYSFGTFHAFCCLYFSVLRHINSIICHHPHHQNRAYIYRKCAMCWSKHVVIFTNSIIFV